LGIDAHGSFDRRRTRRGSPRRFVAKDRQQPFSFSIHRGLQRILQKIGVPEPKPFVPDPFQLQALEKLDASDVLVTAPTGAGKTYIAVEAIRKVFGRGGKSWYASPLKALSNSKYEEFSADFGASNVGILTGDRKENAQAPIIVGTTEILRNQLYDTMHRGEDLEVDLVVLDEAHYLGDEDRGVVWEEVLIYLPPRVKLLLLSATVENAGDICAWLEWLRSSPCSRVTTEERPVPLFPLFVFPSGELTPLGTRRGLFAKIRSVEPGSFSRNEFPNIPGLMEALDRANLLPAIFFLKSRADCDRAISLCRAPHRKSEEVKQFHRRLSGLLDSFPFLRNHQHLSILREASVGAHHGGQLPHWKLLLEKLMQQGHLRAIFSTSTVAAGVNFPARTVVVLQSDRFNGREFLELTATDLLQMTGRAGRRGMDEIGFALVVPGPFQNPQLIHDLLKSPPNPITSQIRVNHSMVLNLLLSHAPEEIRTLFGASLATFQNLHREKDISRELEEARIELDKWIAETACGSVEQLAEIRPRYDALREMRRRAQKNLRRQTTSGSMGSLLVPGRVFRSRRGTPYVAVAHPQVSRRSVEAVRLAEPLRFRRDHVRTHHVVFHRIMELGELITPLPSLKNRQEWEALMFEAAEHPPRPMRCRPEGEPTVPVPDAVREINELTAQLAALPCGTCALFAPCLKGTSHPFTAALQRHFEYRARVQTIQDQLWQSFLKHLRLLGDEGYVDAAGRLTRDGTWASKLRLDQPLLISEGIRRNVFPAENPELLGALIAPFVMDRERHGDIQLSSLVWRFPDLAKPFFRMLHNLQPLRERLQAEGFSVPPMPFWATATVYHWAGGSSWQTVREISGMDEGDLAMLILRTADHLRQIESLSETHPSLAASARRAIELILREPVLVE